MKTVQWKHEGPGGPVWIDGKLVTGRLGGPIWYTAEQAEAIANTLGYKFEEV